MELSLSSDQELLRSSTRNFLGKESGSAQLRRLSESPLGFERGWWATAAELGWTSLLAPESLNGGSVSGDPLQDLAILAEEAGQFAAPGPLGITNAVVTALVHGGITDHAPDLAEIMAGSKVVTWAVYEPGNGWGPLRPSVKAERVEGGFRLTGVKDRVEAGDQADLFLVTAMLDGVVRQFLIPAEAQGISIERVWSLDFTRHFARVTFENTYAAATTIVGTVQNNNAITELQWQVLNVLQCAETCGVTDRAFNMGLEWAMDRIAFGRSLASYQAIKHRFADMRARLEAMHAITAGAVKAVQDHEPGAPMLARAAKVFVSSKAGDIIQDVVQIHGGIGVTWEHDLHLFLRRATVNRALYGTPEELRAELAIMMQADETAP